MLENIVHVSNTPIFDQLSRELGYDRLVAGGPTVRLRPAKSFIAPDAWTPRVVPQITPQKSAKLSVNVHPMELGGDYISVNEFLEARVEEFDKKHPNAIDVTVSTREELDGSVTVVIEGTELDGGVRLSKESVQSEQKFEGEEFVVRGDAAFLPPVFRTEPKTQEIPGLLAERQLALYRSQVVRQDTIRTDLKTEVSPTFAEVVEVYQKYSPEQTDDIVNAASTDVMIRPQYCRPRPLWISEEDDADEE